MNPNGSLTKQQGDRLIEVFDNLNKTLERVALALESKKERLDDQEK